MYANGDVSSLPERPDLCSRQGYGDPDGQRLGPGRDDSRSRGRRHLLRDHPGIGDLAGDRTDPIRACDDTLAIDDPGAHNRMSDNANALGGLDRLRTHHGLSFGVEPSRALAGHDPSVSARPDSSTERHSLGSCLGFGGGPCQRPCDEETAEGEPDDDEQTGEQLTVLQIPEILQPPAELSTQRALHGGSVPADVEIESAGSRRRTGGNGPSKGVDGPLPQKAVPENGGRLRRRPQDTAPRTHQFEVGESIPVADSGLSRGGG